MAGQDEDDITHSKLNAFRSAICFPVANHSFDCCLSSYLASDHAGGSDQYITWNLPKTAASMAVA
jgi:hypothetical protein